MSDGRDLYEDCASCVFRGREPAVCEECSDADQWEPDEDFCDDVGFGCDVKNRAYGERGRVAYRHYKLKKVA